MRGYLAKVYSTPEERLLVLSRLHGLCALFSQICLHKSLCPNIFSLEETDMLHTIDQGLPLWAQGKILSESVTGTQLLVGGTVMISSTTPIN